MWRGVGKRQLPRISGGSLAKQRATTSIMKLTHEARWHGVNFKMKFQYDSPPSNSIFKRVEIQQVASDIVGPMYGMCVFAKYVSQTAPSGTMSNLPRQITCRNGKMLTLVRQPIKKIMSLHISVLSGHVNVTSWLQRSWLNMDNLQKTMTQKAKFPRFRHQA